jgi:hypothetical protein
MPNKAYLYCDINDNTNAYREAWAGHVACTAEKGKAYRI